MAVTPAAAQPPKPPPPPKTEAAGDKKAAAPAAAATPRPMEKVTTARPESLKVPDSFDLASGGRALPSNGGSSFSPSDVRNQVQQQAADLRSQLTQGAAETRDQVMQQVADIRSQALGNWAAPVQTAPPPAASPFSMNDLTRDTFGGRGSQIGLDNAGGGSKPGIGSGNGAFLNALGGGGPLGGLTVPTRDDSSMSFEPRGRDHGFQRRFSWFDFGSLNGGGGGAAGGVADRWNR